MNAFALTLPLMGRKKSELTRYERERLRANTPPTEEDKKRYEELMLNGKGKYADRNWKLIKQEMEAGETAKTKDCLNRFLSSDGGSTVNGKMEPTTRLRCSHFDLSREVFDTQQCVQCLCVLHTAIPQSVLKSSVKTQTHNHESSL